MEHSDGRDVEDQGEFITSHIKYAHENVHQLTVNGALGQVGEVGQNVRRIVELVVKLGQEQDLVPIQGHSMVESNVLDLPQE